MKKKDMRERCVCGHLASHHSDDPEMSCSVRIGRGYCGCDGLKIKRSKEGEIQIPEFRKHRSPPSKSEMLLYLLPAQIALAYAFDFDEAVRVVAVPLAFDANVVVVNYHDGMDFDTEYRDTWKRAKTRGWVLKTIEVGF